MLSSRLTPTLNYYDSMRSPCSGILMVSCYNNDHDHITILECWPSLSLNGERSVAGGSVILCGERLVSGRVSGAVKGRPVSGSASGLVKEKRRVSDSVYGVVKEKRPVSVLV